MGLSIIFSFRYKNEFPRLLKLRFSFPRQYDPLIFIRNSNLAPHEGGPMSPMNNTVLTSQEWKSGESFYSPCHPQLTFHSTTLLTLGDYTL